MPTAIKVEGLSKKYFIGQQSEPRQQTIRGALSQMIANVMAKRSIIGQTEFWALKDIDLEVKEGERIAIIGKNGSGKSTLLKIVSRITQPTAGIVTLNGSIASLLEVGTGFHPELTGRENIYLYGAIHGMSRAEVKAKYAEIVEFSEIGDFLDTPVKRYSSGMQVRLAFSVAAHLEPDILIIDEVLAVGDFNFRKKCMEKMNDVSRQGRTLFLVSHQMDAVQQYCDRVVVLANGIKVFDGETEKGIAYYLGRSGGQRIVDASAIPRVQNLSGAVVIEEVEMLGNENMVYRAGEPIKIKLRLKAKDKKMEFFFKLVVMSADEKPIGIAVAPDPLSIEPGEDRRISVVFNPGEFTPGRYTMGFMLSRELLRTKNMKEIHDYIHNVISFEIKADEKNPGMVWNQNFGSVRLRDLVVS